MSMTPGSRHRQGHGPDPAPLLRAQGHGHVPGGPPRPPHKFRGRLQLLYDEWGTLKCETCFQCAQACPIECIDMGGMDTQRPVPRPLGPARRRTASAARSPPCGAPADPSRTRPTSRFAAIDVAAVDAILEEFDHDPARMLEILEATQAAYGYLPVASLKRISQRTGAWYAMIYGTATYYAPPAVRACRGDHPGRGGRRQPPARGELPRRLRRGPHRKGQSQGPQGARRTRRARHAGAGVTR